MKILATKFKYLGDVAIMVPALRALREKFPQAQIHVLVNEPAAPILEHLPWITKVWKIKKSKDLLSFFQTTQLLWKLYHQNFDLSVDFVGNDRGAIISRLICAHTRLGPIVPKGFVGRQKCFTHAYPEAEQHLHESLRDCMLLSNLDIPIPENLEPELYADPALCDYAQVHLPKDAILCHLSTTRSKKEWPRGHWVRLYHDNPVYRERMVFTAGPSEREQHLLRDLLLEIPGANSLKSIPSVGHFMALISAASFVICSDSLPAHLAGGLGTPGVAFFGPTTLSQWDPKGKMTALVAANCGCLGSSHDCFQKEHCLRTIEPSRVIEILEKST